MKPVWVMLAFLCGCPSGGGDHTPVTTPQQPTDVPGVLAGDNLFQPSYGKAELEKTLIAERGAEASGERAVADLEDKGDPDKLVVARADLDVRRRFILSLEACQANGHACPPRLDDPAWSYDPDPPGGPVNPKLETEVRFDLGSWRKVADEMFGRACACRTIACVDTVGVAIDFLERRPMPDVQGDEVSSLSLERARECLFRLRGRTATPGGASQPDL